MPVRNRIDDPWLSMTSSNALLTRSAVLGPAMSGSTTSVCASGTSPNSAKRASAAASGASSGNLKGAACRTSSISACNGSC